MPGALKVAVQMDPIETVKIDADSTFALMLEAQKRGHQLWALRSPPHGAPWPAADGARQSGHPAARSGEPLHLRSHRTARPRHDGRGPDAAGPALSTWPISPPPICWSTSTPKDAGGQRPRRGPQRAGKAPRHAVPWPDAADAHHLGPRGRSPNSASSSTTSSSSRSSATAASAFSASARMTRISARSSTATSRAPPSR